MVKAELDRIENALNEELPELGRGVAFFCCRASGLWQQIAVSVPLPDGVHFGPRPYLRPLARTRDEHDRYVLVLLSQAHSRFFISQIGQIEEVFQVNGARPPRRLAERVGPNPGGLAVAEPVRREGRVLAEVARLVIEQFEGRYLLTSAPPEVRTAFVHDLPKELQSRIGAEFAVDIHAGAAEVAAAAEPTQRAIEEREEVATIDRALDAGPNGSTLGRAGDARRPVGGPRGDPRGRRQAFAAGRPLPPVPRPLGRRPRAGAPPAAATRSRPSRTSWSSRSSGRWSSGQRSSWCAAMRRGD